MLPTRKPPNSRTARGRGGNKNSSCWFVGYLPACPVPTYVAERRRRKKQLGVTASGRLSRNSVGRPKEQTPQAHTSYDSSLPGRHPSRHSSRKAATDVSRNITWASRGTAHAGRSLCCMDRFEKSHEHGRSKPKSFRSRASLHGFVRTWAQSALRAEAKLAMKPRKSALVLDLGNFVESENLEHG